MILLRLKRFLSLLTILCLMSTLPGVSMAQQPGLKIVVLQGEGAVNHVKTRTGTEIVVEVRDERDLPVNGAEVVFQLPAAGAGGVFQDRSRIHTTKTNAQGQAASPTMIPNEEVGRLNIKVTATFGARTASIVISQRNSREVAAGGQGGGKSGLWKLLVVIGGAGAAGGILAATRGGSSAPTVAPPPPNVLTVTTGPISVSGPR
jgi:hypothetical protein